jgi:hemoglobin-like flavoprotein
VRHKKWEKKTEDAETILSQRSDFHKPHYKTLTSPFQLNQWITLATHCKLAFPLKGIKHDNTGAGVSFLYGILLGARHSQRKVVTMSLNIEVLEQSFEKVKPQAHEFVASFYNALFTDYPEAQSLFAHSDMAKQQTMLLNALVSVIENLRQPNKMTEALYGLGARHVKYGALPEHYPLVGRTLLKTLEQYLGPNWSDEVKQAWTEGYSAITVLMLAGAEYPEHILKLDEG